MQTRKLANARVCTLLAGLLTGLVTLGAQANTFDFDGTILTCDPLACGLVGVGPGDSITGFIEADDPKFVSTVECIARHLLRDGHMFRYNAADDFGEPENAFNICTFWYIDALALLGRKVEARELFDNMLSARNSLGLLSEDIDPATGELWGNFPQTYSMVGLIHSAMKLSKSWEDAF